MKKYISFEMKHILKLKGSGFILDFYSKEKGQTLQGEKGIKISQVNLSTLRSYRIVIDSNRIYNAISNLLILIA